MCIERVTGVGEDAAVIGVAPNPFLATVGLRVEPGEDAFRLGVELGSMPSAFFTAVRDTVTATLRHGRYGWPVTGCVVTMTRSGYWPRQSHAHATFDKSMSSTGRDFRHLTPLVLVSALRQAGTVVCEPVHASHGTFSVVVAVVPGPIAVTMPVTGALTSDAPPAPCGVTATV